MTYTNAGKGLSLLLLACLTGFLTGCWEEIHYQPQVSSESQGAATNTVSQVGQGSPESDQTAGTDAAPGEESAELDSQELVQEVAVSEEPATRLTESPPVEELPVAEFPEQPELAAKVPETPATVDNSEELDSFDELFGTQQSEPTVATTPDAGAEPASPSSDAGSDFEVQPLMPANVLRPSRTALAVWRMCSRWSYAAALYAKGLDEAAYGPAWGQAQYAAELLELTLPELPEVEDDLQSVVIRDLLGSERGPLAEQLEQQYSPRYAALGELAIKTHALLLVYTPKSEHLDGLIAAVRQAAEQSELPTGLTASLLEQLEGRDSFSQVKGSVLQLHSEVARYLAGDRAATTDSE